MAKREIISQIERAEWERLLQNSAWKNYFQSPEYYDFLLQQDFLQPFIWGVRRNEHLMALVCGYVQRDGGLLMRYCTRRAIIMGGVLPGGECDAEDLTCLMTHVRKVLSKRVIYIEVRNFLDYAPWKGAMRMAGFDYIPHYDVHVDCLSREDMMQRMNKRRQRQIRADEQTKQWRVTENPEEWTRFYKGLKRMYKKKIKRPLLPLKVLMEALKTPYVHLLLAEEKEDMIGGMICVKWEKVCYAWYEWGGLFTTWAAMEWAAEQGCRLFDFMGAGTPDVPYGVRDFKISMGGELKELGRFRYVAQRGWFAMGQYVVTKGLQRRKNTSK